MTIGGMDRDALVEAITRQIIAGLDPARVGVVGGCATCTRSCAAGCPDKVRDVVAGGASRAVSAGTRAK